MQRIKNYLDKNPRKKDIVELELLEAGINFYHIVSLIFETTTRKHTREFLIWKAQETLEIMINNIPNNVDISQINKRIKDELHAIREECGHDVKAALIMLGAEIDNGPKQEISFPFDFKVAFMIYLLEENEHITFDDLMAKYC